MSDQKSTKVENKFSEKEYPAVTSRIAKAMIYKSNKIGKKLSWSALAQEVGLTAQAPISWKKGKVSKETLEKIAYYTEVSPLWLITGEGPMEIDKDYLTKIVGFSGTGAIAAGMSVAFPLGAPIALAGIGVAAAIEFLKKNNEYKELIETLETLEEANPNFENEIIEAVETKISEQINNVKDTLEQRVKLVPLISFVQAGNLREAILNAQDEFVASYSGFLSDDAFALEIVGYSMAPEFLPGDKIICDPNISPMPGECVIAQNGDAEATFKKYKPRGFDDSGKEYFELEPINPDYPTLTSKFQDIHIIATVVEHIRSLRRRPN